MQRAALVRNVDDLVDVLEPRDDWHVEVLGVRGPGKCVGLLVDQAARLAVAGVHFGESEALMPALGSLEREGLRVPAPENTGGVKLRRKFEFELVDGQDFLLV